MATCSPSSRTRSTGRPVTDRRARWIETTRSETHRTTPRSERPWLAGDKTRAPRQAPEARPCVEYKPHRCPSCHGERVRVYSTARPIRYLRCLACSLRFRSVEIADD